MQKYNFINPVNQLNRYFDVELAKSDIMKERGYHFRYEIFCKEFHFEEESDCPNQKECDYFDKDAEQCFLLSKQNHEILGTIRLIRSIARPCPFEAFLDPKRFDMRLLKSLCYGEASRLAVHPNFRRRQFDGQNVTGTNTELLNKYGYIPDRNCPLVALSMMLSGVIMAKLKDLDVLFAMMEPKLNTVLAHYGIHFEQVGDLTDYHGPRAAFVLDPIAVWDTLNPDLKPLLHYLFDCLTQQPSNRQIA